MTQSSTPARDDLDVAEQVFELFQRDDLSLTAEQREQLRACIDRVVHYHAAVGILGKTGAGKSALCNALFGHEVAEVSDVAACTRYPQEFDLAIQNGKGISLIDVPGVGESEARDEEYATLYRQLLPELDLALWVIKADDRALSVDERIFRTIVRPIIEQRGVPVVFVVSQIDKVEPCREWDWKQQRPGPHQARNIAAKLASLRQQFELSANQVCAVSAEEDYGLVKLLETIVRILPKQKKWGVLREAQPENVSDSARQEAEQGLWDTVKAAAAEILQESWNWVADKVAYWAGKLFGWL